MKLNDLCRSYGIIMITEGRIKLLYRRKKKTNVVGTFRF